MEPQPKGQGDRASAASCSMRSRCFNGAPAQRPGRRRERIGSGTIGRVLQWSPSPKARETFEPVPATHADHELQWSPSPKARETPLRRGWPRPLLRASMEPQPKGQGDGSHPLGFTGTWCGLQWSPSPKARETSADGQTLSGRFGGFNGAPAQRPGRPCISANGQDPHLRPSFNGAPAQRPGRHCRLARHRRMSTAASMEPQPKGQGDRARRASPRLPRSRFNGAPAQRPGRPTAHKVIKHTVNKLQWSPSPKARETAARQWEGWGTALLQWSPSPKARETPLPPAHRSAAVSFNGAPAQRPGRRGQGR